jgi:alkaline phosphatase
MKLFASKPASTKGEAIGALRTALADATAAASCAHVDRREIATILEQHADTWRQSDAMMRAVL